MVHYIKGVDLKPRVRSFMSNILSDVVKTIRERFAMRFAKSFFRARFMEGLRLHVFSLLPTANGRNTR